MIFEKKNKFKQISSPIKIYIQKKKPVNEFLKIKIRR